MRRTPSFRFFEVNMGWFSRWTDRIRKRFLQVGYACDNCGAELFDYPARRLCAACEEKLPRPTRPCERCGREKRADGLCSDCKGTAPRYERGISPFIYRAEGAVLVNRLKNGNAKLAAYLGEEMAKSLLTACPHLQKENLLLLPVPATKEARRERGFNQAERLAESVLERLLVEGVEGETDFSLLQKVRETKPQKRATRKERAENVKGAYQIKDRARVKGRVVVLVDDVTTTGSTGNEISKRLYKAGAKAVYLLTAVAVPERK